MPQNETISRSPGIRATADGVTLGAVYGLACPALETEPLDTTPLNAEWRAQRPARKRAEDLKLRMLLNFFRNKLSILSCTDNQHIL